LAKERNRGNREAKKPKGGKKPVQTASTFLRPQPSGTPPSTKQSNK
jgi:hypothetical protein